MFDVLTFLIILHSFPYSEKSLYTKKSMYVCNIYSACQNKEKSIILGERNKTTI